MRSYFSTGGLFIKKSGSFAAILVAALAIAVPTLRADTHGQQELNAQLATIQPGTTVLSCSASSLATAVANAIKSSGTSTPGDVAVSALQVYPFPSGSPRPDRNTSAPLIAAAAVNQLLATGTDTNFNIDASQIVYGVMSVGGSNTADNLNDATQGAVGAAGIGAISDAYAAGTTGISKTNLLIAARAIGISMSADTFLEGLSGKALVVIDEYTLAGINGAHGTSTSAAPLVAQSLVQGMVITGTVPDAAQGETSNTFAVTLLSNTNVNVNASVDEYVANAVAAKDNGGALASVESLAESLIESYSSVPGAVTKMTQGIAAVIAPGTTGAARETNRIAYVKALATEFPGAAGVQALEGMVYVDPFYAGGTNGFTKGVFDAVYAKGDLTADAPSIATGVGQILGQDGAVLTQVASTFASYIGTGKLPVASASTYAVDLITGAHTSTVAASQFTGAAAGAGGGTLNLGSNGTSTNIPIASVTDLASIADVFANGIITSYGSTLSANAATAASKIGSLAEAIANYTTNQTFTDTANPTGRGTVGGSVGVFLAGTIADYIVSLNLGSTIQTDILNDISADIKAVVTNSTYQTQITNQVAASAAGSSKFVAITGPVAVQETAVTNL